MIEQFKIENFRNLKDIELRLAKVNLLIGPNNSGKSNTLKAFLFLRDYCKQKIQNEKDVLSHKLRINNKITDNDITFYWNEENHEDLKFQHSVRIKNLYQDILIDIPLKNLGFFKPDIERIKHFEFYKPSEILISPNCSNIASIVETYRNEYINIFEKIQDDLHFYLKDFKYILFNKILDYEEKTLTKVGLQDIQGNKFWADELSEGTLYFLALLTIIHQPDPPEILLLEEPETSIHPRRIKEIIDLLKLLAEEKNIQIIMASHSPVVLNEFKDIPEGVHIYDSEDGIAKVKNLKYDIIDKHKNEAGKNKLPQIDFLDSLADKWLMGFLGGVPQDVEY